MAGLLTSLRENLRSLGWGNGLLYMFARAVDKASHGRVRIFKYYFVAQPVPPEPVPRQPLQGTPRPSKTRIYRAGPDDAIILQSPRPADVIARRFADGAVCYVAEQANALVGFIWIQEQSYCEDEVKCLYVLQPASILSWDYDAYVSPQFRMGRAFTQLWSAANAFLREQGFLWTVSRISAFNAASLASHKRLGIVHLQTGIFIVLGHIQVSAFTCSPFLNIAFAGSKPPVLVFKPPRNSE